MEKLIIFSAPSGTGKTTIVKYLLKEFDQLMHSISATTRLPRKNEVHGVDYYFLNKPEFLHRVAQKEFAEFEEVYNDIMYGTLKSEIERIWGQGKSVIFDIDTEGALRLKRKYKDKALTIFISPPSLEVLEQRLRDRGTNTDTDINERLAKAKFELKYVEQFDILIYNHDLQLVCRDIKKIIDIYLNQ